MNSNKTISTLFHRPWFAWMWWTAPQLLLLLLNLGDYALIADELAEKNQPYWTTVFTISAVYLAIGFVLLIPVRRTFLRIGFYLGFVLLPVALIIYGTLSVEKAIPSTVDLWILNPGNIVFNLWATQVFVSLFGIAHICWHFADTSGYKGLLRGTILTVAPVGVLWILVHLSSDWIGGMDIGITVLVFIVAVVTVLLAFGIFLISFSLLKYVLEKNQDTGAILLTLLIALFLPLAGLALNRAIPFPQYYQNGWVYALTFLNAAILAIPLSTRTSTRRFHLWATAASVPFSLYFFCAFLPFYPMAALAMIAMGAGFLILTPLLLIILHIGKLVLLLRSTPGTGKNALAVILGVLVLPGLIFLGMMRDREAIMEALDYAISPSPTQLDTPPNPARVERAVGAILQQSRGIQYPILSPIYQSLVLQGMTLPDSSIEQLQAVFGLPDYKEAQSNFDFWSVRSRGPRSSRAFTTQPPRAELKDIEFRSINSNRGVVEMKVENNSMERRTEFRMDFELPPGVWISAAELLIEGEWKPADFRERRSAEWIYRMIAAERVRDPLLVTLRQPGAFTVHVFPVDRGKPRHLRLNLESVEATLPVLPFIDTLPREAAPRSNLLEVGGNLLVSKIDALPKHTLAPKYHLFLDRSGLGASKEDFAEDLQEKLAQIPTDAHLQWWLIDDGIHALPEMPAMNEAGLIENLDYSGFLERGLGGRSEGHLLLATLGEWRTNLSKGKIPKTYPVVIPVGWDDFAMEKSKLFQFVDQRMGAVPEWLLQKPNPLPAPDREVAVFRRDGIIGVVPAGAEAIFPRWAFLFETHGTTEILDSDGSTFRPVTEADGWQQRETPEAFLVRMSEAISRFDPATHETNRSQWVTLSKEEKVLLPETALIVLESRAQEEFLKRLEQTGQDGHSGLSFSETPEPAVILVGGFLVWIFFFRKRRD